ncbi:hypothetical protein [Rhodoflexus caldus]|uniref:hypothetical protein n=1 Tax=Rhodoflexus caldus TaxID=2891236 RepID=UPI00202A95BF|nr:hypothetical protein [Rhodoflexus caldus]
MKKKPFKTVPFAEKGIAIIKRKEQFSREWLQDREAVLRELDELRQRFQIKEVKFPFTAAHPAIKAKAAKPLKKR